MTHGREVKLDDDLLWWPLVLCIRESKFETVRITFLDLHHGSVIVER